MPSPSSPNPDFNISSGRSSAWAHCVSAPTSPNRALQFYDELDHLTEADEFAFHVAKDTAANPTVSAAELFHAGKIRPLCGRADDVESSTSITITSPLLSSSKSPKSSTFKEDPNGSNVRKTFWSAFTPKRNKPTNNAHAARSPSPFPLDDEDDDNNHRGRGRLPCLSSSASRRRGTRSLSPIRLTNYPVWEVNEFDSGQTKKSKESNVTEFTSSKSSRMRKLKDFLLFRSASEGRAPRKSEALKKLGDEVWWKRHYEMKKAESEDLKKKTFMPYKRGIFGR